MIKLVQSRRSGYHRQIDNSPSVDASFSVVYPYISWYQNTTDQESHCFVTMCMIFRPSQVQLTNISLIIEYTLAIYRTLADPDRPKPATMAVRYSVNGDHYLTSYIGSSLRNFT